MLTSCPVKQEAAGASRSSREETRRAVVAHPSFGLILANRAVVLGKVSVSGEERGRPTSENGL